MLRLDGEDGRLELPHVRADRDRADDLAAGRGPRRCRAPGRAASDRHEEQPLAVEEAAVDDTLLGPGLLGELVEGVEVAGEEARSRLPRQVLADRPAALGEVLADVGLVPLGQDPALREGHEDDQRGGCDPQPGREAELEEGGQPPGGQGRRHVDRRSEASAMPPIRLCDRGARATCPSSSTCRAATSVTKHSREPTISGVARSPCRGARFLPGTRRGLGGSMGRRTGLLAPAVAMVLCTACSLPFGLGRPRSPAPERARPVALITEGAVFARPGARAAVVAALKRATRRRVIVVAAPSPAADPRVQRLASRFAKDNPHIATYDWREPQCAAESVVLAALQHDIGAVVGEALKALPPPRDPQWDAAARRLVSSGCPFLALAVSDMRPGLASSHHGIRTAALSAMREDVDRRAAIQLAAETTEQFESALRDGRLDTAASILARYAALPASRRETVDQLTSALEAARATAATRGTAEGRSSCSALCAMHMVDICNRDRALWDSHRKPWEQTACGTMRTEAFLKECYQQQWLSGAFHEGCIVPCQRTAEGRERLIAILRGAGCRIRPS